MGGGGGSDGGAAEARADEAARQKRIRTGTKSIADQFDTQFTPTYFDKQRDNYLAYASPQLGDQFADASKELTYALARSGTLNSSSRASKEGELEKRRGLLDQQIKDEANSYRTEAMNNVEGARTNLVQTLNATGDADGAASSAISRAQALSQAPSYSPLAQLFTDFTAGLGTQAAAERSAAMSGTKPRYDTGLFGTPRNAVANIG
jgi:hypothetical protein